MTTKEAIKIIFREKECVQQALQKCADGNGYVSPDGMIRASDYVEACSVALDALHAQQLREDPKPLTQYELRLMNGEPAWIVMPEYKSWWVVVRKTMISTLITEQDCLFDLNQYGKTWLAYRHKPKEGV